ncbi:MAG: indole-3-glycerol phosphate synthase 2 [Phycisphaerae bacterium]
MSFPLSQRGVLSGVKAGAPPHTMPGMANVLERIIETKRREVERARAVRPIAELRAAVADLPPARDFYGVIAADPPRGVHLIAEIKKRSPSAGLIRADFDPVAVARAYHAAGAAALSVLTDQTYFEGRLEYIEQVKSAVPLPVLRKDFMIDPYQLYESRVAGADAVLLIGEVLAPPVLKDMLGLACELGMTSLIEVHEEAALAALMETIGFPNDRRSLLGVNNRDLKAQRTDLTTTERLAGRVGAGTLVVSESGLKTRADVERVKAAGARAILVGESLMKSPDIAAATRTLLWCDEKE